MITFDLLPLHRVYKEIIPNIPRHYTEMTDGDEYGVPDIDWDLYLTLSERNKCVVVTVRDNGKLVGYSVYTLGNNPRYRDIREAGSAGIFLEKEYRGELSHRLIQKADEYLQKIGIQETHYILSDDRVGRLLGRDGYKSKYKMWSKRYG